MRYSYEYDDDAYVCPDCDTRWFVSETAEGYQEMQVLQECPHCGYPDIAPGQERY